VIQQHICTACGHIDSEPDPIERDGYVVSWRLGIAYGKQSTSLSPINRRAVYLIALSAHPVSGQTVELKLAPKGGWVKTSNYLSNAKMELKRVGIPWPIIHIPGEGYLWVGPERAARGNKVIGWFGSPAHLKTL
jgi:hypothetical protein